MRSEVRDQMSEVRKTEAKKGLSTVPVFLTSDF
jgi:hypothetical protein